MKGLKWIKPFFTGKCEQVMNHSSTFSSLNGFSWKPVQKSKKRNLKRPNWATILLLHQLHQCPCIPRNDSVLSIWELTPSMKLWQLLRAPPGQQIHPGSKWPKSLFLGENPQHGPAPELAQISFPPVQSPFLGMRTEKCFSSKSRKPFNFSKRKLKVHHDTEICPL